MRWFSIVFVHLSLLYSVCVFFFFNQKTAYEMRISDWSSDVCSSDLLISGIGSVNKLGAGTVIFSADNSYTGITTIAAGVLQLGGGGTTGSIAGNVVNNAALAFNRSDEISYSGVISGTGILNQIGTGTTILNGANSYAGATNVNAGTLLVDGNQSAATGLTTVASGATLGGIGTIGGDVNVAAGGALAAGSRSEEHTSELQSLMRISYAVFCLKKKN